MYALHDPDFVSASTRPVATLSEILSSFSYALDLTDGQPAGHSLRCAWIGTRLGKYIGLSDAELYDVYYATMLKDLGCSSNAARIATTYKTDDHKFKRDYKFVDGSLNKKLNFVVKHTAFEENWVRRVRTLTKVIAKSGSIATEMTAIRCTRGSQIASKLRFSHGVADAITYLDEHWDGSGEPAGIKGKDIPIGARIALLAQVVDVFFMLGGPDAAREELRERRGTWLDPELCDAFLSKDEAMDFWRMLGAEGIEDRVVAMEPVAEPMLVDEDYLDDIASAFGMVIDAKSPFTAGHSERVGDLSGQLAAHMGYNRDECRKLRRAAILHDVGKLGVSSKILEKPGKLDAEEWKEMQRHTEYTMEILNRISCLSDVASIAGAHHERLDGRGYPMQLSADSISMNTRIITICDIYDALTSDRPYRDAMSMDKAFAILEEETGTAIDPQCYTAFCELIKNPISPA